MTTKPGDVDEDALKKALVKAKQLGMTSFLIGDDSAIRCVIDTYERAKPEQAVDTSKPQHLWNEATIKYAVAKQEADARISKMMNSSKPEQAGVADDALMKLLIELITDQAMGEWTDELIRNDAKFFLKKLRPHLRSPTPTEEPGLAYARKYGAFEASGFTVNLKCPEGCTYAIYDDRERGGRWHVIHSNPTPTGDMQAVREALGDLIEVCEREGDFSNGVTNATGDLDEGQVRAFKCIRKAQKALAILDDMTPACNPVE